MDENTLQLLDGFAHELRTPLSAIAGHASLLTLGVHGPLSDAQAHALDRIDVNKTQLITIISSLLSYAEAASGEVSLQLEECALLPLVRERIAQLERTACEHGVQFVWPAGASTSVSIDASTDGPSDCPGHDRVRVNANATREVITIMLEDALAHSTRESEVLVRVARDGRSLSVVVESTTCTTIENAEILFVPYARDTEGRPMYAPGQSLSLPRARALARAMGADVHASCVCSRRVVELSVPRAGIDRTSGDA